MQYTEAAQKRRYNKKHNGVLNNDDVNVSTSLMNFVSVLSMICRYPSTFTTHPSCFHMKELKYHPWLHPAALLASLPLAEDFQALQAALTFQLVQKARSAVARHPQYQK